MGINQNTRAIFEIVFALGFCEERVMVVFVRFFVSHFDSLLEGLANPWTRVDSANDARETFVFANMNKLFDASAHAFCT